MMLLRWLAAAVVLLSAVSGQNMTASPSPLAIPPRAPSPPPFPPLPPTTFISPDGNAFFTSVGDVASNCDFQFLLNQTYEAMNVSRTVVDDRTISVQLGTPARCAANSVFPGALSITVSMPSNRAVYMTINNDALLKLNTGRNCDNRVLVDGFPGSSVSVLQSVDTNIILPCSTTAKNVTLTVTTVSVDKPDVYQQRSFTFPVQSDAAACDPALLGCSVSATALIDGKYPNATYDLLYRTTELPAPIPPPFSIPPAAPAPPPPPISGSPISSVASAWMVTILATLAAVTAFFM